jgi:hypothetical protein
MYRGVRTPNRPAPWPVTTFCTNGFKGTPAARQAVRPRPSSTARTRDPPRDSVSRRGTLPGPGGIGRHRADSGWAACRALTGGSPPGAAPPPGQQARTRRQAVPTATHPTVTATARTGRTVLLAPGILSPRKDHRQGRAQGRVLRMAQAPPLTVIFHGKTRHLSGGRGQTRGPILRRNTRRVDDKPA